MRTSTKPRASGVLQPLHSSNDEKRLKTAAAAVIRHMRAGRNAALGALFRIGDEIHRIRATKAYGPRAVALLASQVGADESGMQSCVFAAKSPSVGANNVPAVVGCSGAAVNAAPKSTSTQSRKGLCDPTRTNTLPHSIR